MQLRSILSLQAALLALDLVDVKTGIPVYEFKGTVRLSIATKLRIVNDAAKDYAAARKRVEGEMGIKPDTRATNPTLWTEFDDKLGELLDAEVEIQLGEKLRRTDLSLDRNPLTSTVLIGLAPILIDPV